jgi:hypothetical protein
MVNLECLLLPPGSAETTPAAVVGPSAETTACGRRLSLGMLVMGKSLGPSGGEFFGRIALWIFL